MVSKTDFSIILEYIRSLLANQNYVHEYIKCRLKAGNSYVLFWKLQNNNKETHTDKEFITLTHHNKSTQK